MNVGGRFLNWAFGNLDDQDKIEIENHFEALETAHNDVVRTVNQQIEINRSFNDSFKQLEAIIKNDRKLILKELEVIPELKEEFDEESKAIMKLFTISSLKRQVHAVQQNIAASKSGMFDPSILSKEEIEKYQIDF